MRAVGCIEVGREAVNSGDEETPVEVDSTGASATVVSPWGVQRRLPTGNLARARLPGHAEKNGTQAGRMSRQPYSRVTVLPSLHPDSRPNTSALLSLDNPLMRFLRDLDAMFRLALVTPGRAAKRFVLGPQCRVPSVMLFIRISILMRACGIENSVASAATHIDAVSTESHAAFSGLVGSYSLTCKV
jgi:hypothetical protein